MIIAETIVAVSMLCSTAPRRRLAEKSMTFFTDGKVANGLFQVSSGRTLENKMTNEIEDMAGVVSVTVKRYGDVFDVFVVMENMDFDPFNAVVQKKVALYDQYPSCTFNFDLMPAAALGVPALASHAA